MPDPKPAKPTPGQMLDAVPMRNVKVTTRRRGEELVLQVPVKPRWFLDNLVARALLPQRGHRSVALDAVGQEVWQACDGQRTVEAIADMIAQRHRLRFHEARMSVMMFLRDLTERGCIVMVGRDPDAGKGDAAPASEPSPHRDVRRPRWHDQPIGGLA